MNATGMNIRNNFGYEYDNCRLEVDHYRADGSLFLQLVNDIDGPIETLTTCLTDSSLHENEAYIS